MKMKFAIPPLMAVAIASGVLAEDRWVFLPCNFWGKGTNVHALAWFTNTAARAKAAGYNGVLLTSHFDLAHKWPEHLVRQTTKAKAFHARRSYAVLLRREDELLARYVGLRWEPLRIAHARFLRRYSFIVIPKCFRKRFLG